MRVPFSVPFPVSISRRDRAVLTALCLALPAFLAGCAAKNPLIDEPMPAAGKAAPAGTATASAPVPVQAATTQTTAARTAGTNDVTTSGPTGMARVLGMFAPYKIDVQQGNFVSREMVEQLREGMTRDQVRFVLGTPLLTDIFHANRWDYAFRLQKGSGAVISSRVTVYFDGDRMTRYEGGDLPSEAEYLAFISGDNK